MDSLDKTSAILVGLFFAFVCVFNNVEGASIVSRLIGLSVLLWFLVYMSFKQRLKSNPMVMCYALFVGWAVLTYPLSKYPGLAWDNMYTQIQLFLITLAVTQIIKSKLQLLLVINIFLLSTYVAMAMNYAEFIHTIVYNMTASRPLRFSGTIGNANGVALYGMLVSFSVVIGFSLSRKTLRQMSHLFFSLLIGSGFIIQSGSRKGMLGLVIIFFLIGYYIYKANAHVKWLRIILILLPLVLTAFMINFFINSPFFSRFEMMASGNESSMIERLYLLQTAYNVWTQDTYNFLIGVGYGQFVFYNRIGFLSHNSISEATVTTGLIGFLLYFSIYISFAKNIFAIKVPKHATTLQKIQKVVLIIILINYALFEFSAIIFRSRYMLPYLGLVSVYVLHFRHEIMSIPQRKGLANTVPST